MARVLIIDDDPKICKMLTGLIQGIGHDSSAAHTLEVGRDMAQEEDFPA